MRIYSMTATFGKLDHQTLTLKPGLNIIEAPNEWGKSTWCAFLVAMLYGLDTRAKSTKSILADKERYQPWSGSPMAGRLDLDWNGRKITIERRTKGRTLFGEFRAYETDSGLDVPELTAANCGQLLLGVEKNVFTRAGFLRLSDLPVTQDETLRRRLNALVTTGDESGASEALAQKLRDLKNRCRHNRTGLLPQTEARQSELLSRQNELTDLKQQLSMLRQQQTDLEDRIAALDNHRIALQYEAAQAHVRRIAEAAQIRDAAALRLETAQQKCADLPSKQEAESAADAIRQAHRAWLALEKEAQQLPPLPQAPEVPIAFSGLSPEESQAQVEQDSHRHAQASAKLRKQLPLFWILAGILAAAGLGLLAVHLTIALILLGIGVAALIPAFLLHFRQKRQHAAAKAELNQLYSRYLSQDPVQWRESARDYAQAQAEYEQSLSRYLEARGDLDQRKAVLEAQIRQLSGNSSLQEQLDNWLRIIDCREELEDSFHDLRQAEHHLETAQAMAVTAPAPQKPDLLHDSPAETDRLHMEATLEYRRLQLRLGQAQGRMDALGDESLLQAQLDETQLRLQQLEDTYAALELAQNTLAEATAELQRRFAPKISTRAQELFNQLTGTRYDRLILGDDLSLSAAAADEDTIRTSMWRSDGTVDQLYLALRLAVAGELTPDAPLILDDALVRFDDVRLAAAMKILRSEAEEKQVILFTCQSREANLSF